MTGLIRSRERKLEQAVRLLEPVTDHVSGLHRELRNPHDPDPLEAVERLGDVEQARRLLPLLVTLRADAAEIALLAGELVDLLGLGAWLAEPHLTEFDGDLTGLLDVIDQRLNGVIDERLNGGRAEAG